MLATFAPLDWAVLGGYCLVLLGSGVILSRREQRTTEDYFLGGRRMPAWAVAVSILATGLSAATFVGAPESSYKGNLTYLSTNIGMVIAAVVLATTFLPVFYRHRVATIYELLETRFGRPARSASSAMFMVGRVFASGARIFIIGIPAALILFGEPATGPIPASQIVLAIGLLVVVGIGYTLVGGITSVIWADVIQAVVFLGAVIGAIVLLVNRIPAPVDEIASHLASAGKLEVFDLSTSLETTFTLWASVIGFTLLGIASYGVDQDLVQRMLTCKSAKRGSMSIITANLMAIPIVAGFLLVGVLLFVFYKVPGLMGDAGPAGAPSDDRTVFLSFILSEMPAGLKGLMLAGLFAAGLSSLNSALNAMSSTFINDFYLRWKPDRTQAHYVRVGRRAVVVWGTVLGVFASGCVFWQRAGGQTLIDFALGVMAFAYAGLLGVFFTALYTKRGNSASVIAALVVGFVVVLVLTPSVWAWGSALVLPVVMSSGAIEDSGLIGLDLAFPWRLTMGAGLAMLVCMAGSTTKPKTLDHA